MRYQVPQFLERETKIVWFLSFKQLILFGAIGIGMIILYYILPRALFILVLIVVGGGSLSLILVRIDTIPLYQLVTRSVGYFLLPRTYIWKKKETITPIKLVSKKKEEKKEKKQESPLKASPESKIDKLSSQIETGLK